MKRFTLLLLCLLMISALLCACVDKTSGTDTTVADAATVEVTAAETEVSDNLPAVKYEGYDFCVLIQEEAEEDFVCTETETGDPINDAVLRRNQAIEDRFGITVSVESVQYNQATTKFRNSVRSGTNDYDMALLHMVDSCSLALDGSALPFEKLPYVDLSRPWWDKSVKNGFSINNNLMMANGDISPSSFSITSCLFFNKTIFDRYDYAYPYESVVKGEWTMDKLYELTTGMSIDVGGDGDASNDQYGLVSWYLDVPFSFYYACGGMLITKDENDYPQLDLNVERNLAIVEKLSKIINDNKALYETAMDKFPHVQQVFAEGRAMFYDAKLSSVAGIREMDDSFGILPVPKYDADQAEYYSFVNGCSSMLLVPSTCPDVERTSIIIEAMACESYKSVTPVLYETYLKRKMSQDAESMDMIDYIVRNRVFDMAYVNMQDGLGVVVRDLLTAKSTDVASRFQRLQKSSQKKLDRIIDAFEKSRT